MAVASEWTLVRCDACGRSQVDVEMRRSIAASGKPGAHLFARIRNRNPHPVALVLVVTVNQYADSDGSVIEPHVMQLGAAGDTDAERVVMLRATAVRAVAVEQVERF